MPNHKPCASHDSNNLNVNLHTSSEADKTKGICMLERALSTPSYAVTGS